MLEHLKPKTPKGGMFRCIWVWQVGSARSKKEGRSFRLSCRSTFPLFCRRPPFLSALSLFCWAASFLSFLNVVRTSDWWHLSDTRRYGIMLFISELYLFTRMTFPRKSLVFFIFCLHLTSHILFLEHNFLHNYLQTGSGSTLRANPNGAIFKTLRNLEINHFSYFQPK